MLFSPFLRPDWEQSESFRSESPGSHR